MSALEVRVLVQKTKKNEKNTKERFIIFQFLDRTTKSKKAKKFARVFRTVHMSRWLGCLLLLLVTTSNAAENELTEIRAALRSLRLEIDALKTENTALSARLRATENPATTADPEDAAISAGDHDLTGARRLEEDSATSGKAPLEFNGAHLRMTAPLAVDHRAGVEETQMRRGVQQAQSPCPPTGF